jgi:hypothetical protein
MEEHIKENESSSNISKHIDKEYYNDDEEEYDEAVTKAINLKPYFSNNTLPSTLYLKQNVLPLVFEALTEVEKIRPKDPIEFFCAYILEKNKK